MAKKKKKEEGGPKAPAYIVTFSDMVTLLLTFFVMLLTLANEQDPELVNYGRASFVDAIDTLGLGHLKGFKQKTEFGNVQPKYSIEKKDKNPKQPVTDVDKMEIRKRFEKVKDNFKTLPSLIISNNTTFSLAEIYFEQGSSELDEEDLSFIEEFCSNLKSGLAEDVKGLYVLGVANDVFMASRQMTVSAERAGNVAQAIKRELGADSKLRIYSWGAGDGGQWVSENSMLSERSQILIGIMRDM